MKDWCTWFPEHWVRWVSLFRWEVVYIGDLCKAHDDVDDHRGGCASHPFIRGLLKRRIVGAIGIFTVASIACWIRYPKDMWRRL
jgi:hypothetical protein